MRITFKSLLIAGGLALGAAAASFSPAQADGRGAITLGGPNFSVTLGQSVDYGRGYGRGYGHGYGRRGVCTPRAALRKAERRGLRRAHIRRIGANRIVVSGRSRGQRINVVMGRHPSCPVFDVRSKGYRDFGRYEQPRVEPRRDEFRDRSNRGGRRDGQRRGRNG